MQHKFALYSSVRNIKNGETGVVVDCYPIDGKTAYKVEMGTIRKSGKERIQHVYYSDELEQIHEWFPERS